MKRKSMITTGAVVLIILFSITLTDEVSTMKVSVGAYFYPETSTYRGRGWGIFSSAVGCGFFFMLAKGALDVGR